MLSNITTIPTVIVTDFSETFSGIGIILPAITATGITAPMLPQLSFDFPDSHWRYPYGHSHEH